MDGTSRPSICTLAPGLSNLYLAPLMDPVTVIPVLPVYSYSAPLLAGAGFRIGAAILPLGATRLLP